LNRRHFLTIGLTATAALATGTGVYSYLYDSSPVQFQFDDDFSLPLLTVIPVFLDGALSDEPQDKQRQIQSTIKEMQRLIDTLPSHTQQELQQLFQLLNSQVAHLLLVGNLVSAADLTIQQQSAYIESWRTSFLGLLNDAYDGLKELVFAGFYGNPDHFDTLGYVKPELGLTWDLASSEFSQ